MRFSEFGTHLARTLSGLTVPQGYTLSIAGTLSVAAHRYGTPSLVEGWIFVVGAVVAFLAVAVFPAGRSAGMREVTHASDRLKFNAVPLASMAAGAAVTYEVPWPVVGYSIAGIVAVLSYVLLVSAFFALVHPSSATRSRRADG